MLLHPETIRLILRDMQYYNISVEDLGIDPQYSFFRSENIVRHRCGDKNIQKIVCALCLMEDLYEDIESITGGKHIKLVLRC